MWIYVLFVIPAILAFLALKADLLAFKVGVPAACAAILVIDALIRPRAGWLVAWVVAAFGFSVVGDYFLSNKGGDEAYFIAGIGAYGIHCTGKLFSFIGGYNCSRDK